MKIISISMTLTLNLLFCLRVGPTTGVHKHADDRVFKPRKALELKVIKKLNDELHRRFFRWLL